MDSICQYFKMYFPLENHEFCCPIIHLGLLKTCNCKSCNVYHINWYLIVSINLETKVFPKFWSFSCHNLPNQNVSPIKTARLSTAHCNLVMSRAMPKGLYPDQKSWHLWWVVFFSKLCMFQIPYLPKNRSILGCIREHSNKILGKFWSGQTNDIWFHVTGYNKQSGGFETRFCQTISPDFSFHP